MNNENRTNENVTNDDMIKRVISQIDSGMFINPEYYNVIGVKNDDLEIKARDSHLVSGILDEYLEQINWQKNQGHLTVIEYHQATSFLTSKFSRDTRDDVAEEYKNQINRLTKHFWNSNSGKWEPFKKEEAHEYALINVHPSRCVVKTNKNGSKSVKWKKGGKAYKEIPSFNVDKANSYVQLANEIADIEQEEALDYLEQVAKIKGIGKEKAREWALKFYNQFQESKTTIDTFSDNRTGNKYSEWNDEERISANMMFQAFGLKTNEEIFKELNPYRLRKSFERLSSLIALYQLLLGSETLESETYTGVSSLAEAVCWKRNSNSYETKTALVL
tara:strand:+ start:656 stop:1651 length:996 start_codon:yes stop_codon:yes gene_type:complete